MSGAEHRSRQESTDSLESSSSSSSSTTAEDYSDEEEKDGLDVDDFHIIKTVGEFKFVDVTAKFCVQGVPNFMLV